jgi:hypothetical protein
MREMGRLISGLLVILLSSAPALAQDATVPPLQRTIDTDLEVPLPVNHCSVPNAVTGLVRQLHLLAGVEYLPGACSGLYQPGRSPDRFNLRGLSVADALKKLVALDPRYRWLEADGVIVMRPVEAWTDPENMLNFKTSSFALENATLGSALHAVMSALDGWTRADEVSFAGRTDQGSRLFSVKTGPTSAGGAIDAIVRAHGVMWWELKDFVVAGKDQRVLWLRTFDGSGLGAPLRNAAR